MTSWHIGHARALRATWIGVALCVSLAACRDGDKAATAQSGRYRFGPAPGPVPQRIVSLAPNMTEILFALGVGARVVGVTRFCDYPASAKTLPKVGGFLDVNVEVVASLRPALVVGVPNATNRQALERLGELDMPVALWEAHTLKDVYRVIRELGVIVGEAAKGARLVASMRARVAAVQQRVAGLPRPKVLFTYGRDPLIVAGPATFAGELIALAGGVNVVREPELRYRAYSIERVLREGPQVIVDSSVMNAAEPAAGQADLNARWSRFASLPAVRTSRLHWADPQLFARPGPRLVEALEALAALLHPRQPQAKPPAVPGK